MKQLRADEYKALQQTIQSLNETTTISQLFNSTQLEEMSAWELLCMISS